MGKLKDLVSLIADNDRQQGQLPRPISAALQYQRGQRLAATLGRRLP